MFAVVTLWSVLFSPMVLNVFCFPLVSDGKAYDAYILYPKTFGEGPSSNLDTFVFKLLPEVLEGQFGYKLFICGRDDYAGEGMQMLFVMLAAEF